MRSERIWIAKALLGGVPVAGRIASVCNDHVLDFVAASGKGAKSCYANYLLMWEMIIKSNTLGKEYFDAGGIDPAKNAGGFNFKKGLNGQLAISGPVWYLGSRRILGFIVRNIIERGY